MKREDLIHTIDAIKPEDSLRAKVMALPGHSRPRLEHPLRHLAALGTAALLCAGIVTAVLALQNGAAPGGSAAGPNPNPAAMQGGDTPAPTEVQITPSPSAEIIPTEGPGLKPAEPKLSPTQDIGADMAEIDFASDNIAIFHGYFGLFVYDLKSKSIIRSVDLAPIGCDATQGDNCCMVEVSKDGNTVLLHPVSSKNMYVYTVSDNTLRETGYTAMEDRFTGFVDPETDAGYQSVYQKFELCSYRAVRFGTGEYGYLHATEWIVGTLTYVRGGKVYKLFEHWPTPSQDAQTPQPTPADSPVPSNGVTTVPTPYPTPTTQADIILTKNTLPKVNISPDQAISIAKKAYKDDYSLNVEDCLVVDSFSYSQDTVYGTGGLWETLCKTNAYAGKQIMDIGLGGSVDHYEWTIELRDGAYGSVPAGTLVYMITIDAASGKIVDKSAFDPHCTQAPAQTPCPTPEPTPSPR